MQVFFHIFTYCYFFIGEINLEILKRIKRLLLAILHFEIIGNQKPGNTTEVFVCMDMTVDEHIRLHIRTCFSVYITAA